MKLPAHLIQAISTGIGISSVIAISNIRPDMPVLQYNSANKEQMPEQLDSPLADTLWRPVTSEDSLRLRILQMYPGSSIQNGKFYYPCHTCGRG